MRNVTDLNFDICLAPMVGLTHVAFRKIVQDYMPLGAETHWPTEMLSTRKIPGEDLKKSPETLRCSSEKYLVPQILGNEEKPILSSILRLAGEEWGASGIDINMGCPVQKALRHNYGVSLMGDVDYAARVVGYAKKASALPVSVKLRAIGDNKTHKELIEFVSNLVDAGADWITLHPRTAEQQRRGAADWQQIAVLKENLKIPIIGNGDIQVVDDVVQMKKITKADKIMVGRALTARPWLVWQYGELLGLKAPERFQGMKAPQTDVQEGAEYGRMLQNFINYCELYFIQQAGLSEGLVLRKVSFFIRTGHVWLEFGHHLLSLVSRARNLAELRELVALFFSTEQRLLQRTDLRQ